MKIDKTIKLVIEEVLKKHKQPYIDEFTTFIEHVLSDTYTNDEIMDRINSISLEE